jgi:dienelactone hydrolase
MTPNALPNPLSALVHAVVLAALLAVPSGAAGGISPVEVPKVAGRFKVGSSFEVVTSRRRDPFGPGLRRVALQVWFPIRNSSGPQVPYMPPGVRAVVAQTERVPPDSLLVRTRAYHGPPASAAGGPLPTIVFSPGFGMSHSSYTGLLEDLASRGFVVVALDHIHETVAVNLPSGVVRQTVMYDPHDRRLMQSVGQARASDIDTVLAAMPRLRRNGRLPRRATLDRIGIFGHSLGGRAAVLALARQPAIDCAADLDGSLMRMPARFRVGKPLLVMTGTEGLAATRGFRDRAHGPRWFVHVVGAQHLAFSDWLWLAPALAGRNVIPASAADAGGVSPMSALEAQRAYLAAFFGTCLKGLPATTLNLARDGVRVRR